MGKELILDYPPCPNCNANMSYGSANTSSQEIIINWTDK